MSEDAIVFIAVLLLVLLFAGEPDIADAIRMNIMPTTCEQVGTNE